VKRRSAGARLAVVATPQGGKTETGELTFLDNAVDSTTGTIMLKDSSRQGSRPLAGAVRERLPDPQGRRRRARGPLDAIQTGQSGTYVFLIKPDGTVDIRPVVVRRNWGVWALITSGLNLGDRVVTDGQLRLAPERRSSRRASRTGPPGGGEAGRDRAMNSPRSSSAGRSRRRS